MRSPSGGLSRADAASRTDRPSAPRAGPGIFRRRQQSVGKAARRMPGWVRAGGSGQAHAARQCLFVNGFPIGKHYLFFHIDLLFEYFN